MPQCMVAFGQAGHLEFHGLPDIYYCRGYGVHQIQVYHICMQYHSSKPALDVSFD